MPLPNITDWMGHERLVAVLATLPDGNWARAYLELAGDLLNHTGLTSGDSRLAMSLPKSLQTRLPVTLNIRYVLWAQPSRDRRSVHVGVICGREFVESEEFPQHRAVRVWQYGMLPGENPSEVPYVTLFPHPDDVRQDARLWEEVCDAAMKERNRWRKSPVRKYHQPAYFQAAMDPAYRDLLLEEIWGDNTDASVGL